MNTTDDSAVSVEESRHAVEWLCPPVVGEDASASSCEGSRPNVVTAGQAVARIAPGADLELGTNVAMDEDGVTVRALAAGLLYLKGRSVRVAEVLDLPGDVDFSTGNIDCPHDVLVRGSILDLFRVRSGGTVHVGRSIESAEVFAARDIVVSQAIAGKDKGRCVAGGSVRAKLMTAAQVEAVGDVTVTAEVAHCRVVCGGELKVPAGAVYGGEIVARRGVECGELGCPAGACTVVAAGIDQELRRLAEERVHQVLAEMRQAAKVRKTLEPLMGNQRTLTPQQKEKATELLFQADEIEERNRAVIDTLRRSWEESQSRCRERIDVQRILHAGVVLRFAGLEAVVHSDTRGPLSVVPRRRAGRSCVAVVTRGREVTLETRIVTDETMLALQELLAISRGVGVRK